MLEVCRSLISNCFRTTNIHHSLNGVRFATNMTKSNTSKNTKGSAGRRLGLKKFVNEKTKIGQIIARQRGTKWHPGENVSTYVL